MGIISFFKGLFGADDDEIEKRIIRPQSNLVAVPDQYERFEDEDGYGFRADSVNPNNELADFLKLYEVHPWVYSCVYARATAAAQVEHQVIDEKGERVEKDDICKMLCRPNPHQVWFEFIEVYEMYKLLTGNVFVEEVRDKDGKLYALYLLRPDKMRILPHPKAKVAGYVYEPMPGKEILFSPDEITHVKLASSSDEYWGVGPGYAAQNSIILDIYATTYNKNFFRNSAVPEGVLETEGSISDNTYKRLRLDWMKRHRGVSKAFEVAILEEGLKYKPIGFNQRDMMMPEMKKLSREEILSTYRVPPIIVGLLEHAGVTNPREQKKMFWMDVVFPDLERTRQIFNEHLMPPDRKLKFNTEAITSIIEDMQISTQIAMSLVSHGIMTIDEVRKKLFNMAPVPWGKRPWMPVGLAQWDPNPETSVHPETPKPGNMTQPERSETQDTQQAINQATPMGGSLPRTGQKPRQETEKRDVDFEKMVVPDPDWNDPKKVSDWRKWQLWKGLATPDYREIAALMKSFFSEQLDRFTPMINREYPKLLAKSPKKAEKGFNKIIKSLYSEPYEVYKDSDPDIEVEMTLFDISEEDGKLKSKMVPKSKKIISKHGKTTLGEIRAGSEFNLKNPRIEKFLDKNLGAQVSGINKKTRELLRRELTRAYKNGEDADDMMKRIHRVFKGDISEWRARTIARTEIATLTQFARLEAAKQSGVVKKKRWVSELLATTRDREDGENHRDMHDVTIPIDEKFDVPSRGKINKMDGPGDPSADAENIVNCLCILDFPGTTEEFEDIEGDLPKETKKSDSTQSPVVVNFSFDKLHMEKALGFEQKPPIVNNIINVPEAPPTPVVIKNQRPRVRVRVRNVNKVQSPDVNVAAPKVKIENKVEKQAPAPVNVTVQPAEVKLEAKLKMPKRKKTTTVQRDERTGRIQRTEETEENVEE